MLIDWFTVGAQALNFLILVGLMKHFLYQPILRAIDTREKKIAAELADADARRDKAKKDCDEYRLKNEEFDQQRAALLAKATAEAGTERQRLISEARKAADDLAAKRQESLRREAQSLNQAIALRTQAEVFAIARKALAELATTSLEERMGEVFTRRLRELDANAKGTLGAALKQAVEPAVVRSAFDLPADQRAMIQNAVNETFAADIHLRFETKPELVGGIELTANGQKVAWSIADYLLSLEKGVSELLKQQDKPDPEPEAKSKSQAEPKAAVPGPLASEARGEPAPKSEPAPKPDAKVDPGAKPAEPAKSSRAVKAGTTEAGTSVEPPPASAPEARSGAEFEAPPAPSAKPEPGTASEPAAEGKPSAAAEPSAAPKPAETKPAAETKTVPAPANPPAPKAPSEPAEATVKPAAAETAQVGS